MTTTSPRAAVAFGTALIVVGLLTVNGFAGREGAYDSSPESGTITVVLDTTVLWSEHPTRIGLEGGWEVEPTSATWIRMTAEDVAPGRTFRVVGVVQPRSNPHLILDATIRPASRAWRPDLETRQLRSEPAGGGDLGSKSEGGDDGDDFRYEGYLVQLLPPDQFSMDDARTYTVDGETRFDEPLVSYQSLEAGQFLRVDAVHLPSGVNLVERVRLEDDGGGDGIDFRYEGSLVQLLPPDQFSMDDARTYTVDGETRFDEPLVSYQSLEVGQFLRVDAVHLPSGVNLVERVRLEDDDGDGDEDYEGIVAAISESALIFDSGLLFVLTPTTIYKGDADAWYDILPGWEAEVEAYTDGAGNLVALEVRADDSDPATTNGQDFEPQQALVVPVAGANPLAIATRHQANIVGYVGDIAVLFWWPDEIDNQLLADLDADPEIRAVEPNYLFRDPESVRRRYPIVDRQPTDEKFFEQPSVAQTGMRSAHFATRGSGTVVAVMDTGVDPQHPILEDRILADGLDLVDGDTEPWEERNGLDDDGDGDLDEAAGHGTFVASIVVLAAPETSILPYRVLDDDGGGNAYNLALAIADAIARGVDVINLSLVYHSRSSAVDLLLEEASTRGITVVCAAGNDQSSEIPFPASDSQVIAVTALREDGLGLTDFANRSELVVMAAPGEVIYGALDLQQFGTSSGTSMATPFVAATVALLRSVNATLDPVLIRQALEQTGIEIGDGLWQGIRLNIQRAVEAVAPMNDLEELPAAAAD